MAFIQKVTPPQIKIMQFSLKDFSGGMNNRSDQIEDNEGARVINLMFADDTLLETRYGQKYFDDKVIDGEVVFIDEFKPYDDDNVLIRASDKKIYFGDDEYPLKGIPSGTNFQGKYYYSDGEKLMVYGKFTQESDTYNKIVGTPVNEYMSFKVISPPEDYTPLDTEHTQGVTVIDYTNKTIHYEPCQNELEDTDTGDCVIPESVKYVVSHNNRLYVSGNKKEDDSIYLSDENRPFYFPYILKLQVPPSSDNITGLHVFDDSVVIGREWDIFVLTGKTNRTNQNRELFKIKKLNTHTGFASHRAVNIAHNYLIFLGSDGNVYGLQNTRTYERDLATVILSKTIDLKADPINLDKEDYKNAVSHFYNDEWYLNMKDITLVYSYRHMAWVMYKGLNARSCYGYDGEWIWGRPEGRIATFDKENFFDFGEPYQTLWYSKPFDMGTAHNYKQFREFFLVAHTFDLQYSDVYVTFEIDYADVKERAVISNQIARWGFAKWGDRFITRRINESLPFVIGRRGRTIRFKITNNFDLDGVVDSYEELENYPAKREGLLVKLSSGGYYLYTKREWKLLKEEELNQRMKIYQINGDFEMRGNR